MHRFKTAVHGCLAWTVILTILQTSKSDDSIVEISFFNYTDRDGRWVCSGGHCHDFTDVGIDSFYYASKKACLELSSCGENKWFCPESGAKSCAVCNSTQPCPGDKQLYATPDECQNKEHCHPQCGSNQLWTRYRNCRPTECSSSPYSDCNYGHDRAQTSPGCVCDAKRRKVMHKNKCILVDECPKGSPLNYRYGSAKAKDIKFYCGNSSNTECSHCNIGGIVCPENVTLYNSSAECLLESDCEPTCGENMHWSLDYACDNIKCNQGKPINVSEECAGQHHPRHHGCACNRGYFLQRGVCVKLMECDREERKLPRLVLYEADNGSLSALKDRKLPTTCADTYGDCQQFADDERCQLYLDGCMATCGCCSSADLSDKEELECFLKAAESDICLRDHGLMVDEGCGRACCRWLYLSFRGKAKGRPQPNWELLTNELRKKIVF